ncbi:bifunctional dethiobiotin synthetase/7,8-diamino-pelargonic acid aminotransferase, mitochondrial-like [Chenopodium quinoa]|uniref:bifunctional dethiobiotin synthetase/7,8-diamino-pelargonic acid aminotransferase, mitochondrial-like n=1 Tax=Chenopodium quinoa TaxID=63459 RepID=UPI000B77AB17|nr:bifunctional dethiobiotin synthetase/7,8-diamino-pelargonic acid aminotransferase, mitochondrial-like [Chenopodium quinoa]
MKTLSILLKTSLSLSSTPLRLHCRFISSFPLSHPIYTIWAANTNLGKTLISAGIASSVLESQNPSQFHYIKPVQTGFPSDSDSRFVFNRVCDLFLRRRAEFSLVASNHLVKVSGAAAKEVNGDYEEREVGGEMGFREKRLICRTLCAWNEAVSPHLAVEREGGGVEDEEVLEMVEKCLWMGVEGEEKSECWSLIETAGGVASPGPSGTLQCDLYRPFRTPAVLVGDGRLGGISGTISAYETLKLRGYDVVAVVLENHGLANDGSLLSYLQNSLPVLVLPPVPQDLSDDLMEWFDESHDVFASLKQIMLSAFSERVKRLHDLRKMAGDILWWPFTQHQFVPKEKVTVIDSRCGENFAVHKADNGNVMTQQFDACASWWTQGPSAALQIELARDMGYAAARYGHVMFPENVYEPALECAELLLEGVGKGWASRTFFSDNGSTATEVALKMAFRKFLHDNEAVVDISDQNSEKSIEFRVLALNGSYHGDTLGAMEAQAPSSFTGFLQQPWYIGRGLFVDPPTLYMQCGKWNIQLPDELSEGHQQDDLIFESRDELFSKSRDTSDVSKSYASYLSKQLSTFSSSEQNKWIAALIIEPVIHGAGGMYMIDPLFQRILVRECQKRKIPVIFDEVFTGFWRLGVESAAELLHCTPDIACYAKLLTGGIIPLAVTLATEAVFDTFMSDSKLKALLHGHSYSAHAMGCTAAAKSIKNYKDEKKNPNLTPDGRALKEIWDAELVNKISMHPQIKRLMVLGTVFAVELQTHGSNAGYASTIATSILQKLREDGIYARPLGNVIYLMCGPYSSPTTCSQLLVKLYHRIDEFHKSNSSSGL